MVLRIGLSDYLRAPFILQCLLGLNFLPANFVIYGMGFATEGDLCFHEFYPAV